ncbi:hypothetical protein DM01DRAFT_1063770 [Hesseltinella vesiculosa]|uniref:Uncharacterized protein n=1 Tax=Hesseltinella vesiculosa TaxID=101127 RepID=A0A1X2GEC8_9FUNG|nr:hypothetical protein DM01DRAFT_1063770 [Hesseltinella vesiculosa]
MPHFLSFHREHMWIGNGGTSQRIGECADKVPGIRVDPVFINHISDGGRLCTLHTHPVCNSHGFAHGFFYHFLLLLLYFDLTTGILILMGNGSLDALFDMKGPILNGVSRWLKSSDGSHLACHACFR